MQPLQPPAQWPASRVALLLVAAFSVSAAYGVTLPLLPLLLQRLPLEGPGDVARHTGWLTGVYTLALFTFSPLWGALSDRLPRRLIIALGLLGGGMALWALDRASTLAGVYGSRIAAGVLAAAVLPSVLACVAEAFEPARRRACFAWISTATALGFLLGPWVGNALRAMVGAGAQAMGGGMWMRDSPLMLVGLGCAGPAALALWLPRTRLPGRKDDSATQAAPAGWSGLALVLCAMAVFGITVAEVGVTLHAQQAHLVGTFAVAGYFALCSIAMVVMQLWAHPWLERALGERWLVVASFAAMTAGLTLLAWPQAAWMPALAFLLAGAGIGILLPTLATRVATAAGSRQGRAMGRQAAAANLGQGVGASLTGVLYAAGAPAPFLLAALVLLLGAALAIVPEKSLRSRLA